MKTFTKWLEHHLAGWEPKPISDDEALHYADVIMQQSGAQVHQGSPAMMNMMQRIKSGMVETFTDKGETYKIGYKEPIGYYISLGRAGEVPPDIKFKSPREIGL